MPLVLLVRHLQVLGQQEGTFVSHLRVREIQRDQSWDDALDQLRCLRAQLVVRKIENLQVEVSCILFDQRELLETPRVDAAVRQVKLLNQRGCFRCGDCLEDSRETFVVDAVSIFDGEIVSQIQTCQ